MIPSLVAIAAFWRGLHSGYFADDFQFLFDPPGENLLQWFGRVIPGNGFYRPLQAVFMSAVQAQWGMETWPIHAANLILHASLALAVTFLVWRISKSPLAALASGLLMAVSQGASHAVLSNDTQSQVMGTLMGVLGIGLLWPGYTDSRNSKRSWGQCAAAVAALGMSLLSKESSVGLVGIALVLLLVEAWTHRGLRERVWRPVVVGLALLGLVAGYWMMRSHAGAVSASVGEERYAFSLGLNLPRNIALLFTSALLPVSSVDLFVAAKSRSVTVLGIYGLLTALWAGIVLWGMVRSRHKRAIGVLSGMALMATFPMFLLQHVSELYSYNVLPFVAGALGLSLDGWFETSGRKAGFAALAFLLVLLSHGMADQTKAEWMNRNGRRAAKILESTASLVRDLPGNATVLLVSPETPRPRYSVFLQDGFQLVEWGGAAIKRLADRPDLTLKILDRKQPSAQDLGKAPVKVTLDQTGEAALLLE